MNAHAYPIGLRGIDRLHLRIQHAAAGDAIEPGIATDRREVRAQAVEHRRPIAWRQMQGAGAGTGSGHECSYTVATREVDDTCSVSNCLPLQESCGKWLLSAAPPGGRRCEIGRASGRERVGQYV